MDALKGIKQINLKLRWPYWAGLIALVAVNKQWDHILLKIAMWLFALPLLFVGLLLCIAFGALILYVILSILQILVEAFYAFKRRKKKK